MTDVRLATPDDAAALHELAAETFPLACPPGTLQKSMDDFIQTNLSQERFAAYLADENREIWVADDFAGYTMLVYGEPSDRDVAKAITTRPTVELSKCYARAAQHGQGVAAALVETSVAAAQERGAAAMWLGVSQLNGRANRFYEKNGFVIVGEKTFMVGDELNHDFARERIL
jgi:ribosomal protein S18 acetylase RimI-like enzyme